MAIDWRTERKKYYDSQLENKVICQKYFKYCVLLLAVSFGIYVVEIQDWLLNSEIFFDLISIIVTFGSVIFLFLAIFAALKYRRLPSQTLFLIFVVLATLYITIYGNRNGMFWGKKIIDSAFIDDQSRMDMTLYENGKYIIYSNWLFGENRFEGKYKIKGDTIIFDKAPDTKNDFINKMILVDKNNRKIYFKKNQDGTYDKSFYYFQIKTSK